MNYVSLLFVLFFAVLFLLYYVLPKKAQWIVLLAGSLCFYAASSPAALPVLALETLVLFFLSRAMERSAQKKRYAAGMILLSIAVLFLLMYVPAFVKGAWSEGSSILSGLIAPLGISYYTLMMISYTVDVCREEIPAEKNYAALLLFGLYFPAITQGPMSRYQALSVQLRAAHAFEARPVFEGLLRFGCGAFKKLVVANRVAVFSAAVVQNEKAAGVFVLLDLILFMVMLYSDFSGCADMAIGMSRMLGIDLPENFWHPYFSRSVSEYWRRWHLTLSGWLRDYIYYPLTMSKAAKRLIGRKKEGRKQRIKAVSCVAFFLLWMVMGIWHGAGLMFLVMGLQYAAAFILTYLLEPVSKRFAKRHPKLEANFFWRLFQKIRTIFLLWPVFLHVTDFAQLGSDARRIFTRFQAEKLFNGGLLKFDLSALQWILLLIGLAAMVVVSNVEERKKAQLPELILRQKLPIRILIYWFAVLMLLLSLSVQNTEFIYAQY